MLVVGLIAYPFYRAVSLSFTDKLVGYPERWVGLRNYIYLINDDTFRTVVRNSLVFTVASVALKILTGIAMVNEQLVAVLDLERLLRSSDIRQFDEGQEESRCEAL